MAASGALRGCEPALGSRTTRVSTPAGRGSSSASIQSFERIRQLGCLVPVSPIVVGSSLMIISSEAVLMSSRVPAASSRNVASGDERPEPRAQGARQHAPDARSTSSNDPAAPSTESIGRRCAQGSHASACQRPRSNYDARRNPSRTVVPADERRAHRNHRGDGHYPKSRQHDEARRRPRCAVTDSNRGEDKPWSSSPATTRAMSGG